ncbi:MAG: cytochrome c oxidase subunit II [Spirochaetales bacterium]|jgi:cytochrome c oxidase subunit 2|nr:cytochrome c oxidase subunit II [Spirochaetales bacterium]|tara:strand:- start:5569 stop:6510 length:942 start_codon:yes stop_codon:yes gene_type:complete
MNWLPPAASTFAYNVDFVLTLITVISVVSCVLIAFLLIYFVIKYRRRSDNDPTPAITHDSFLETLWTVIPTILCIVIFIYGYIYYDEYTTTPKNAYEINVTAKKWMWSFDYPNGKKTLNELYVPLDQPIRLVMQSEDVLHSFFVPAFRVKQDTIGNRYTFINFTATEEGVYKLYCTEYCGAGHSNMDGKVHVLGKAQYAAWESNSEADVVRASADLSLDKIGKELHQSAGCVACHNVNGADGGLGPTWKGLFGTKRKFEDGSSLVADENYLRESIEIPTAKMVKGYQPIMPAYKGVLDDSQITALIAYIKTLK